MAVATQFRLTSGHSIMETEEPLVLAAVVYTRVSTDEQSRGYSLQTQLEGCQNYAAQRGLRIDAKFSDDYTGDSMERPGLDQLRQYIETNKPRIVVVYDLDRLSRRSIFQMLIEEELNRKGVRVEYVLGQYTDTDEGRLQKQIRASIAEYEKAKILERSKRGKMGKAKSGFVLVGPRSPYGYKTISEPHKSWLAIDEDEAKIVKLVFNWYLFGNGKTPPMSMNAIAVKLQKLGILTRGDYLASVRKKRGRCVWSAAMIIHILKNETYTGVWHYGKTKMDNSYRVSSNASTSKRGLGKQVPRDRQEWVAVDVPAIINRDLFDQAQERIRLNREMAKRNRRGEYLLSSRLKCSKCGYTYSGITRRTTNRYYRCSGANQAPTKLCGMLALRADIADEAVWQWVKSLMEDPRKAALGMRARQSEDESRSRLIRERLDLIESQIREKEAQLKRLLDLYLSGGFPVELLVERKESLQNTIRELKVQREECAGHLNTHFMSDERIAQIESFLSELRVGLDHATFEDKRRYFELLDVRGQVALEEGAKVIYITCKLGKQRVSVAPTLPSSNTGEIAMRRCACPPTPASPLTCAICSPPRPWRSTRPWPATR